MKIISWNIQQGGGSRVAGIINALIEHDADVISLAECRPNNVLAEIRGRMGDLGWIHQHFDEPEQREYGLLILSKQPITLSSCHFSTPGLKSRWCEISLTNEGLGFLFVHIPNYEKLPDGGKCDKELCWDALLEYAGSNRCKKRLIVGDLNTGLPADGPNLKCGGKMRELLDLGWMDVWRLYNPGTTEFTWYGRSNGFRLDHAFASPPMFPMVQNAFYSHSEREKGISDHSILIADIMT